MTAFILAAGKGTRLFPITQSVPKPMVRVAGRPLLEHTIKRLASHGIRDLIINLHYRGDSIQSHFGDGTRFGVRITYSPEAALLGTAGALVPWRHLLRSTVLVVYGDNLSTCDIHAFERRHQRHRASATVALFWRDDVTQSGVAVLDSDERVRSFIEKPAAGETTNHWVNAGLLLLEPSALDSIPEAPPADFGRDLLPKWARTGELFGYQMSSEERLWWADTPVDLASMEREFQSCS